ncbi:hypothetical protein [Anaerosacchariphilus polymeriproducens]|uniref:Uncharacterized protein n=1 Tax=Anaerosacchariphilus polymeriproducens TaxID=1812858 RepID=A0A371ATA4_9FIRM|nr:hypothetical protein [Anaerosacchariphilus polymeriproducens]RDU22772.1 hypothetical protein DWV06_13465 [Anaerosacchariphilus polymeriproducens]
MKLFESEIGSFIRPDVGPARINTIKELVELREDNEKLRRKNKKLKKKIKKLTETKERNKHDNHSLDTCYILLSSNICGDKGTIDREERRGI